jgi:predicted transcriptional regulator
MIRCGTEHTFGDITESFHYIGVMSRTRLIVELDENLTARVQAVSGQMSISAETFAAKAVARAVAELEAWAEDEAAYAEYERTGEAIPVAAVEEWVRSWGTSSELPPPVPCKLSS